MPINENKQRKNHGQICNLKKNKDEYEIVGSP